MAAINFLEKLISTKATGTGQYLEAPGRYVLEVDKLLYKPEAFKGPTFIAEFKVLAAEDSGAKGLRPNATKDGLEPYDMPLHKTGATHSFVKVLEAKNESTFGDVMAFIEALTGCKAGEVDAAGFLALCSDEQPAKGWKVGCTLFVKPQKAVKTKQFTHFKWAHIERGAAA